MNIVRRKELQKILDCLEPLKDSLESVYNDEEEAFCNIPDNLSSSDRYTACEEAVDNLSSALDYLEEVINYITEASM